MLATTRDGSTGRSRSVCRRCPDQVHWAVTRNSAPSPRLLHAAAERHRFESDRPSFARRPASAKLADSLACLREATVPTLRGGLLGAHPLPPRNPDTSEPAARAPAVQFHATSARRRLSGSQ